MHQFESKKRQILDRIDLYQLISEHVSLKRSGKRWLGLCPFHSEKTPSFTVNPELGLFKCFGCGKGGDLFSFVQQRENVSFMEALKMLADRAGVELEEPKRAADAAVDEPGRNDIARANAWALGFFRANFNHATIGASTREYFFTRGFDQVAAEKFEIGLAAENGPSVRSAAVQAGFAVPVLLAADLVRRDEQGNVYDTFRNRLIFPIHDQTGRVIGFGGRTLGDDRAKYLNTRQNALFDKGRNLYGIHLAREAMSSTRRAVVVEGYTDCIACQQSGIAEAVASLGTALTESQVDLLRRFCDEVILLFDSDEAGETAADRAISVALPRSIRVKLARIPDGKDPCEFLQHCGRDGFSDVLKRASDALEFKWLATRSRFSADTSDARRKEAIVDFLRVVGEAASTNAMDAIQQGLLINQVAHLLRMGRDDILRLMKPASPRRMVSSPTTKDAAASATSAPRTEEQRAWTNVMEVLLNEPALLGEFAHRERFERIAEERDRRIAVALRSAHEESAEVGLVDLLARCTATGDAERVGELVRCGALRGNFGPTLELAAERIARCMQQDEMELVRRDLIANPDSGHGDAPAGGEELNRAVVQHRHFAPRRMVRKVVGGA